MARMDSLSLDDQIRSLDPAVSEDIQRELRESLRALRDAGDATGVMLRMSRLSLKLITEILQSAGHKRPSDNLHDAISRAWSGDPTKKMKGLHILPGEHASCLHFIRTVSNKIDHDAESTSLTVADAEMHLFNFLKVMQWFYCSYEKGPQLAALYSMSADPASSSSRGRVVVLFKRSVAQDEHVASCLERGLSEAGYDVVVDREASIGLEWARRVEETIREADFVVALLSELSVHSEMLAFELSTSRQASEQSGDDKPRVIPVRVCFEGAVPQELTFALEGAGAVSWNDEGDDPSLVSGVAAALEAPRRTRRADVRIESVGGALPMDSRYYIDRRSDEDFHHALERGDATVLVKGPRQVGKTSLLARGVHRSRETGAVAVFTDYQKLGVDQLESTTSLFIALGELLADQLDLDVFPTDTWNERRSPNLNFDRYLTREVLRKLDGRLVWAMDEVDRLFRCPFSNEVFALFRTWHNARAVDPDSPWSKLTLVIAYATEAHLFITDINQSPFNVGTSIGLEPFTEDQVEELNARYGGPLSANERTRFFELIGGQPFLAQRGLVEIVKNGLDMDAFESAAARENGPYGDHLRRILVLLANDPQLESAVRALLAAGTKPDVEEFYRLRSGGLLAGDSHEHAAFRCEIYERFLREHLQ